MHPRVGGGPSSASYHSFLNDHSCDDQILTMVVAGLISLAYAHIFPPGLSNVLSKISRELIYPHNTYDSVQA